MEKTGFFEEKPGQQSMTRMMMFMNACIGCFMIIVHMYTYAVDDRPFDAALVGMAISVIATGAGTKLIQKKQEKT